VTSGIKKNCIKKTKSSISNISRITPKVGVTINFTDDPQSKKWVHDSSTLKIAASVGLLPISYVDCHFSIFSPDNREDYAVCIFLC